MSVTGDPSRGRVALVTGSGRNIGRAIALSLASDGADVVVNVRQSRDEAESVAEEIRQLGVKAIVSVADITDPTAVDRMFSDARSALGPVTILVNNAAVRNESEIDNLTYEEWRRILAIILDGAFLCSRAAVPHMREAGWGRIVNIAGISGQAGANRASHVVSAKAGILGLTKALALELASVGITVNAVSPGMIDTVRRRDTAAHHVDWVVPLGRRGTPQEAAAAVRFLASAEAAFITGQTLNVNGGAYIS